MCDIINKMNAVFPFLCDKKGETVYFVELKMRNENRA